MKLPRFAKSLLEVAVLGVLIGGAYLSRASWLPWFESAKPAAKREPASDTHDEAELPKVLLTDQAIANLGLVSRPLTPESYWKTILVPGSVVDRPGHSDRNVVAPIAAVVVAVYRVPGETVRPGEDLFILQPLSEPFHQTQTDLYKAMQEIKLTQGLRKRLESSGGVVPEARFLELDTQITRLEVAVRAYRQELQSRGLAPDQIDAVASGNFVKEIRVGVPLRPEQITTSESPGDEPPSAYEVQELKVALGQQVQAGQTLCLLADHERLAVEGRAFPDETALLERTVKEGWRVTADFQEPPGSGWPAEIPKLPITHLANTIDPASRTFAFLMPLENQSRTIERDGRAVRMWRFRPGQKVRLHVPFERLDNVFVLPTEAVVRDGPEAYVFTQNVNTFERRPVRVLTADRDRTVIANDGSLPTGLYVAQSAAAQLNRMIKSQSSDAPKGYHMHADGSLHKNEDEHK